MKTPMNLSTAEPDFDDNHFADCGVINGEAICTCDSIERDLRDSFAAMKADWANDSAKCY